MPSTAVHPTASLTVPSTQNTAVVLDFCCLYTHDLRRKAKRWQDGILRFHTFNKRIMVYDVSRNFIGDTHWRESGLLQDGDELQLEKGVLIQVGELSGSANQDISSLFEKRRPVQAVSPKDALQTRQESVAALGPIVASASGLRPRTLNSVLGTPKGPLGRAAVPSKSPCQLRRENHSKPMQEERPSKRQRVGNPSENASIPARVSRLTTSALTSSPSIYSRVVDDQPTAENVIPRERDSALQNLQTPAEQIAAKTVLAKASKQDNSSRESHTRSENALSTKRLANSISTELQRGGVVSSEVPLNSVALIKAKSLAEFQHEQQGIESEAVNRLQIISRKPRKKLLYGALLPLIPQPTKSIPFTSVPKGISLKPMEPERQKDPQSKFHQAQQNQLQARLQKLHEKERRQAYIINEPESPKMFIDSEEDGEEDGEEGGEPSLLPSSLGSIKDKPPDKSRTRQNLHTSKQLQNPPIFPPFTKSPVGTSPLDQIFLNTFSKTCPQSPRNFQPPELPEPPGHQTAIPQIQPIIPPPLPKPIPPSHIHHLNRSTSLTSPTAPPPKRSSFRKTVSDLTAPLPGVQHQPTTPARELAQDQKADPWSREAWDLFGHERPQRPA